MADGAQSTALARTTISTGGQVAPIVPQNFDDAWRIAGALAQSGITPFKEQSQVLAVIMAGAEVGLTPFASTQSFAMINGRATMWGDGMLAVVRARGHRVEEWTTGAIETGDYTAFCKVTRIDTGEVIQRDFSMGDAKTAKLWGKRGSSGQDTPWITYPKRMIGMRARSWALRDGCADILRGIKMAEEVQDYAPEDVRVIEHADEYDQRPASERAAPGAKIGGQAEKDRFDAFSEQMSACADADALEIVWSDAERARLSSNRTYALAEHYEACKDALENGREPPAAPKFAKEEEPSPFDALKTEAAAIKSAQAFTTWAGKLTPETLGRCSEAERAELRTLYKSAKTKHESAGAGGKGEDAGRAEESGAATSAGAEAPPASSSSFEALKEEGLAILQMAGTKQQRKAALGAWRTKFKPGAAGLTDEDRAALNTIHDNVAREIGA